MEYQASYLPADSLVDRETALKYLRQGYPLGDIQQAAKLAKESGKTLAQVLPMRTVTCDWQQVKEKLGLQQEQNRTSLSPSEDAASVAAQALPACIHAT